MKSALCLTVFSFELGWLKGAVSLERAVVSARAICVIACTASLNIVSCCYDTVACVDLHCLLGGDLVA